MSRRTEVVTITTPGRDKGSRYLITEMPADQGERWALRALLVLSRGGIQLPPGVFDAGMAGLASMVPWLLIIGVKALHGVQWADLEPLLNEMMACIQYQPPGNLPAQDIMEGVNSQIQEIRTRLELRKAVLELHVDPSLAAVFQTMGQPPAPADAPV